MRFSKEGFIKFSLISALCLFGFAFACVGIMGKDDKVFADVASLDKTRPSAGDMFFYYHNGQAVGINWTQLSRQSTQDINWVGLSTTSGAINWNYVGQ